MTMTAAEVKKERERRSRKGGGGKNDWVKIPADSTVYLRIGPPWKKDGEVWKDSIKHGYYPREVYCAANDQDEDTGETRRCKVDKRVKALKGDRSNFGKKLWSLIHERSEGLWNVLVVSKKVKLANGKVFAKAYKDNKFKILRLSPKWQDLLLVVFENDKFRKKSLLGVSHPLWGRLIKVRREGSGKDDTNYTFTAVKNTSKISKSKVRRKKLLATLINLDGVVSGSSDEELAAFLRKMEKRAKKLARLDDDEDDDDDDEDDEKDEDGDEDSDSDDGGDEEDEDEAGEDDEDDLEKRYRKMKKKNKNKKKHKEEDDDDDEDEED